MGAKLQTAGAAALLIMTLYTCPSSFAADRSSDTDTVTPKFNMLKDLGIFSGFDDGTARLDENMTREQFATVLLKLCGLQPEAASSGSSPAYNDVNVSRWSFGAVEAVSKAGIMNGTADRTFAPEENVTFEQLAATLVRAFGLKVDTSSKAPFYGQASSWAKPYISTATSYGLIIPQADYTKPAARSDLVNSAYVSYQQFHGRLPAGGGTGTAGGSGGQTSGNGSAGGVGGAGQANGSSGQSGGTGSGSGWTDSVGAGQTGAVGSGSPGTVNSGGSYAGGDQSRTSGSGETGTGGQTTANSSSAITVTKVSATDPRTVHVTFSDGVEQSIFYPKGLPYGTPYQMTVSYKGNVYPIEVTYMKPEDNGNIPSLPHLKDAVSLGADKVLVHFDDSSGGLETDYFKVLKPDGQSIKVIDAKRFPSGRSALLTTESSLTTGQTYILTCGDQADYFTAVPQDTTKPILLSAIATSDSTVVMSFNKPLDPETAGYRGYYAVTGLSVKSAELSDDGMSVTLTTTSIESDKTYYISVYRVTDLSGNAISPGQPVSFHP